MQMSISALGESWVRDCSNSNLFFLRLEVSGLGMEAGPVMWTKMAKPGAQPDLRACGPARAELFVLLPPQDRLHRDYFL